MAHQGWQRRKGEGWLGKKAQGDKRLTGARTEMSIRLKIGEKVRVVPVVGDTKLAVAKR